jgi:octaprenyl-diphosphate synthase
MDTSILAGIADYDGAVERAVRFAQDMLVSARADLIGLPGTPHKQAMEDIAGYLHGLLEQCRAIH